MNLLTVADAQRLAEQLQSKGGSLVAVEENLVDTVWADARPPRPCEPVEILKEKYAGKSMAEKIADIRKILEDKHAAGYVVSMLDEVAWLFNLRGQE